MTEPTRIFWDMEYTGLHQRTTLISIGLVTEQGGQSFYGECIDYDPAQVNEWLHENVIKHLWLPREHGSQNPHPRVEMGLSGTHEMVAFALRAWLSQFERVEMWGDCLAYDWVLFCELFGGAMQLPKNVYYIPFDICTLFKGLGIDPDISREAFAEMTGTKHNALHDAQVIRECYRRLVTIRRPAASPFAARFQTFGTPGRTYNE